MPNNLRLILDEIELVRESIRNGSCDSLMWHPAYERLNALVLKVCTLVPEDGDERPSIADEDRQFVPSIGEFLEAAFPGFHFTISITNKAQG